jgi:hypothetical protein
VQLVGEDEEIETVVADTEHMNIDGEAREMPADLHAMWTTPHTSGRAYSSPSPPLSAVSFPTRGWASPGGSVMSAPTVCYPQGPQGLPPRTSPLKQAICYLRYGGGATSCLIAPGCRPRCAARRQKTARPISNNPRKRVRRRWRALALPFLIPSPFALGSGMDTLSSPGVGTISGVGAVLHVDEEGFPDEDGLNEDRLTSTVTENAMG